MADVFDLSKVTYKNANFDCPVLVFPIVNL